MHLLKGFSSLKKLVASVFFGLSLFLFLGSTPPTKSSEVQVSKISESNYRNGVLVNLNVPSPETDFPMRSLYIWTPQVDTETAASLPIVYFLHGWPGSPLSMIYSIVPALDKAFQGGADPFIAVFPDGNAKTHIDSEWADSSDRKAMIETWLTTNVISSVEGDNPRSKEQRAIVGFSMGGYGATMVALHHPELFAQIGSLAGYFVLDDLTRAFTDKKKIAYETPSNYLNTAKLFRWYLAEAKDDYTQPIHGEMVRWSTLLKKMKVSVETHAPIGGHSFAFVTGQIPSLVKWLHWPTN